MEQWREDGPDFGDGVLMSLAGVAENNEHSRVISAFRELRVRIRTEGRYASARRV